jgi:hypothetical protein
MKFFFSATIILICKVLSAQQDSTERQPFYGDHVYMRFTFDAGITNIRPAAVNEALFNSGGFDQLLTFGATENMTIEPLNEKGYFGFDWTWSMHWYVADKLRRSDVYGKQIEHKLDGWEFMMSNTGLDLFAHRNFDVVVAPAWYFGTLKLYQTNITDSLETKLYKNPFVCPAARAEIRLNFGPVTLGGRFSYRYDITHDIWQRKSEGMNPIPGYKFRDTQFMIYIGIRGPFV